MSEETATATETEIKTDSEEPSMEDILSSIRKILSEEESAEDAPGAKETSQLDDSVPTVSSETEGDIKVTDKPVSEDHLTSTGEKEKIDSVEKLVSKETNLIEEPRLSASVSPDAVNAAVSENSVMPEPMAEMLELTPDMVASDIMSQPTARASVDVLSELASAILDRRDVQVHSGSKELTIESMVREMLKPILREWLDRNLPYLIERLVKKEIDLMVNRAERLDS